ncbi:MAG TPA: OmpA family protein [Cyclobacteriaceae bacterium]|nr:OmpA family protein [Cyclobacteriaceae bacterium]
MKNHFFVFFLVVCLLPLITASAQKPGKKFKKGGVIQLNDSLTTYSQSDIFTFPNVNVIPLYGTADKLKQLMQVKKSRTEQEYYFALREYVKNFGIENFATDTQLLWDLARLSEHYGEKGEAVLLYKLVLKHHRQNINGNQVQQEFDTLTKFEKDYYVPLEQYYQLVAYRKEIDTLRPPQGVLINMGQSVNSMKADYAPTIGNVDTLLLFSSKRNAHAQQLERTYDEDLFYSVRDMGFWMDAQEFKTINTNYNEGSACLSLDGKYLFFARCNSPDSHGSCDIFVAEMVEGKGYRNAKNLGTNINSTSWDSHPSLSHSGDTLFFSSDRLGGFGLADIYYSVKGPDGKWQKAKNIGPIINTRNNEVSPFFHHKFNVLYFSSNGQPLNFGSFDIYKSYLKSNAWTEPKNIGPLVNGVGGENYFTIDSKSKELFYARSEENDPANYDLHSFPVPMGAQPEAITTLKGTLKNSHTGKPFKGIVSIIDLDHGVEVAPKFLRPDGSFDFQLINKRNYLLIIQGDDFFRIEEIFFLDGDMEINKETEPLETKIAFKSLEFESGKANILDSMHRDLDKLANFMIDHPHLHLTISGHTDSEGKADANLRLSQARADAIKAYLEYTFNIEASRITAVGYGGTKPIVEEKSDDHRKLNRRVEFEIKRE